MMKSKTIKMIAYAMLLGLMATSTQVQAAKKKKTTTTETTTETTTTTSSPEPLPPLPPTTTQETPPPPPLPRFERPTYNAWGTIGGLTLGAGNAMRLSMSTGFADPASGHGYYGFEALFLMNLTRSMDIGVGGRLPLYPFGVAPGADLRIHVFQQNRLHMALDLGLYVPMTFFPVIDIGVSLEPGLLMSYMVLENLEIFWGLVLPAAPMFYTPYGFAFNMGFDLRSGAAFNLKRKIIGFFAYFDVVPGFSTSNYNYGWGYYGYAGYPYVDGAYAVCPNNVCFNFDFRFQAGIQLKL